MLVGAVADAPPVEEDDRAPGAGLGVGRRPSPMTWARRHDSGGEPPVVVVVRVGATGER
jgi:hypothetical protein